MNQEVKDLKRHIKKIKRRIRYLEKELENKKEYIKELEDIEITAYKNAISNISFTFNNDGKINPKDFDINSITSYEIGENFEEKKKEKE